MRIIRFILICFRACNPLNPRLSLTWEQAWIEADRRNINVHI